jgi:hypothetical protein
MRCKIDNLLREKASATPAEMRGPYLPGHGRDLQEDPVSELLLNSSTGQNVPYKTIAGYGQSHTEHAQSGSATGSFKGIRDGRAPAPVPWR